MKFFTNLLLLVGCCSVLVSQYVNAQCIETVSCPPALVPCNAGAQTITATTNPPGLANSLQWTGSGVSGSGPSVTFTPNCGLLGVKQITPYLPAGTSIPSQSRNIPAFSGNIPYTTTFSLNNICSGPGIVYEGLITGNVSGANDDVVNICVNSPSLDTCLNNLPVSIVNGQLANGLDIGLLLNGAGVDPNGDWSITFSGTANSVSINAINLQMTYPNNLTGNVTGTSCTFNVTAELPPCPTSVNITTPSQVCSGGGVDFTNSNPGNIRFIITSDAGFSYNNIGFPTDYPSNTTCAPIIVTYNITAQCTNNNSTLFTGTRTVTVYPDIDLSAVIVDNTTNINDPNCAVLVTAPCPTFTINGQGGGSASLPVSPGDNGTVASVAIGNGFCTENINVPLTCIGSCVPPTTSITTNCPTSNNFSVVVQVTDMGDLSTFVLQPSQGNPQTITQVGTYTFAGNANNSVVNLKVLSVDNPSCNTNLGNFTEACKNCPSITNVLVTNGGSICSGANIGLSATVPNATENVDYQIQWQLNGTDIPGANTRQYAYTAYETGCQPQIYNFTARIICLNNGNPPASDTYTVNPITVYPIPQYGTDFFAPDDCSVVPIASPDCANLLTITTNPTPPGIVTGQQIMVSYSVRVNGAPSTCFALGRFIAGCPSETCTEDAGAMEPRYQQVCWGEDFVVVKSTPPLGLGFRNYIKVIDEAGTQVATYGPYQSTDVVPPFEFTNDNSSTYQAGHTYCFTPTLLFNGRDLNSGQAGIQTAYTVTDSGSLPPLPGACITDQNSPNCTNNIEPYIYNFTIEGIPYCPSVSSYNVTFTWNDNNTVFNPIGNNILIGTLPGVGITSDFPGALSSISDDGTYSIVYDGNPNGKTFNFLAIQPNPLAGCNWNWNLTITLNDPPTFPVVCPSCNDVGESACVQLLPSNPVGTIATPAPICVGSTVDLYDYNPTTSQSGTYVWYAADPATGAAPLANPNAVEITQTSTFYVEYETNVGGCATTRTVTFSVTQPPTLNTPTAEPICPGTSVDLTLLQPQITTAAGTFTWYIGDPENGGARLNVATAITPIGSEKYYCVFTSNQTGCSNSVYIVYNYHPIPLLLPQAPSICTGTQVNLRNYEAAINPNPGTFIWTNSSGTVLNPNASNQILVTPTNGAFFDVAYTDAATGCSNEGRAVTFTVNANTPLAAPTVSPVCSGTEISLTALQPTMTNATGGTFTWTTGGNPVPNPSAVVLNATTTFNASYTNASGCVSNRNVTYTVNPGPTVLTQNLSIPAVCPATSVNLTTYQPQISTDSDFVWYAGDPNLNPPLEIGSPAPNADPANQVLPAGTTKTYYAILTRNACKDTVQVVATWYNVVSGVQATYNCTTNRLEVNLSAMVGGTGTGYTLVQNDTLNQDNDVLAENDTWTIIVSDSQGCLSAPLSGTVDCISCNPTVGVPIVPTNLTVDYQADIPTSPASPGFTTPPSGAQQGTPNFAYGVTNAEGIVIGLSDNGAFEFVDENGVKMPPGEYCFTQLVYDNFQIDAAADGLIGAGDYDLGSLLGILPDTLHIENLPNLLGILEGLTGIDFCIAYGDQPEWCVNLQIACTTPPTPSVADNTIVYCTDAAIPTLAVAEPTDPLHVIRWFDAQTGGNMLFTGNNFTPSADGTYWVELALLSQEETCHSERVSIALTGINPPNPASVTNNVTLSNGQNTDFPTTVDLDNLVSGNTNGVWSAPSDLGYNATSHIVNANGRTPGTYTATYTINAQDPCSDISYTVVINVAGACQSPNATGPVNASYCISEAIPAISVDNPGSEYIVNWYDSEFGGAFVGTGISFTPLAPGTYWAEVVRADDPECRSLARVAATVAVETLSEAPYIEALELCLNFTNMNPVLFSDLVPANATGTWTCVTPSAGCNGTSFNPDIAGVGNYIIRYTTTGDVCGANSWDIPISVIANCSTTCNAVAGVGTTPADTEVFINDPNPANNVSAPSPGYNTPPSNATQGTPNHLYIITDPNGIIVDVTLDGSYNFTGVEPTGTYCFTGFAYDAGQVDEAADALSTNPITGGQLGSPTDFHTLKELLLFVKNANLVNPFTIPGVIAVLPTLENLTGVSLCYGVNTTPDWCVEVKSNEPCPPIPNPSGGTNVTYCNDGTATPSISVNDPGADFVVNWYNAATGGDLVGLGVAFTPSSAGDYWAEIVSATRTECVSNTRKKITLTTIQPPLEATVESNGGAIFNNSAGGSTNISLSTLVTGNTNGSWTAQPGNPSPGGVSGNNFNANGLNPGTYSFTYNINATAPCVALSYSTSINVIDPTDCTTATHIPVATNASVNYCANAAIPAISIQTPPADDNVIWFDADNQQVGTGISFVPTVAGTYCAQLVKADDPTCVSAERACITLTAIQPASATVQNTATIYLSAGQSNGTVNLCSLTTATTGTWSENGAGSISGCNFSAPEGVYTVQYTVPSPAPCAPTVYSVTVNIVNCGPITCQANAGVPIAPSDLLVCLNQDPVSPPSPGFSTPPSGACQGTPDYTFIVTQNSYTDTIMGISNAVGEYDFSNLAAGTYCFTGLAFNAVQVDAAADSLITKGLVTDGSLGTPADFHTLAQLLSFARGFIENNLGQAFTITTVRNNLPLIGTVTGVPLCTGFANTTSWCVTTVEVCSSQCTPPAAPIAANSNVTICSNNNFPALSVTSESGTVVKWYGTATGGTSIATGNSFTPTACGTYYAEAERVTPANCLSTSRTAITLTCVPAPISAIVVTTTSTQTAACASLALSSLITTGNTNGTWTSSAGGTINGNTFTAANTGDYTLTYTIVGNAPCSNLVYTVAVGVTPCGCDAATPTNPQGATVCAGNTAAISVAAPAAGFGIRWYNTAIGGTAIATANSFTPTACGTYYAETYKLNDVTCVSTRVAVTLTCSEPIEVTVAPITITVAAGSTTGTLDLTTLDLPAGTWTVGDCGGVISNNSYTGELGTCSLNYTIDQPAPCQDNTIAVSVTFVGCENISCNGNAGVPTSPTDLCVDDNNIVSSPSLGFDVAPSGACEDTPDYIFIVTNSGAGDTIVGLSADGTFDFSGLAYSEYCFTGLAYNAAQVDAAADVLLGPGDYTLADLLAVARNFLGQPLTIALIQQNLPLIGNLSGVSLCTGFGDTAAWCIDFVPACVSECIVPAAPVAVNASNTICEGSAYPALTVNSEAGTTVKWYDAAIGGTVLATGNSFTPTACGTYYAETWRAVPDNCFSTSRTALSVTCVAAPSPATVVTTAQIQTAECSSLSLSSLITTGNTNGTWTSSAGGTINGNTFTAANTGDYTLTYTIVGNAPCSNLVYTVAVGVTPCGCDAVPPTNPQGATVCAGNTAAISVAAPAAGFGIRWYNTAIGGTAIATANSFTPTACGTYYAETYKLNDVTCVSTRVAVTLTCSEPIDVTVAPITITVAAGSTTGTLDLTTLDLPAGTWTVGDCGGVISNNSYTGELGTCSLNYTIDQPAPCQDNTIAVSVTFVGCENISCNGNAGVPTSPTDLCVDDNNIVSSPSLGFDVAPSGACEDTPDYIFIVTNSGAGDTIVGLSADGTFDFSGLAYSEYCFTGLAYNAAQVDAAADVLLGPGDYTLADLLAVARNFLGQPLTIALIQQNLPLIGNLSGVSLCTGFGDTAAWCIDFVPACVSECIAPAAPVALEPTIAVCADVNEATLNVTSEANTNVVWYDSPTGGNIVGTGNSLTAACGVYYAQTERIVPSDCVSETRTMLTIECIAPLEPAEVATSAQIRKTSCASDNSIDLYSLILSGNTSGIWSLNGTTIANGIFSSETEGTFQLSYVLTPTDPCLGYTYIVPITVIGCECGATVPTNPQNATVCEGSTAAISVDAAPAGYQINWYDAATVGNLLGTGNSFTPESCGTYYAQTIKIDDATCASSRVAVTLSCVTPIPATATSVTEYLSAGATTADVDLCALNLPAGTWSVGDCGGSISSDGCTYTGGEGTCVLLYTVDQPTPCQDNTLSITVNIVSCGVVSCAPNAGVPTPPTVLCVDVATPISAPSLGFDVVPSGPCEGTPDYAFILTDSANGDSVITVSANGSFDFGQLAFGDYCVTGLAYNATQIDAAADSLLGLGNYTLADLLNFARGSGLVVPFDIPTIEARLPLIATITGVSLCYDFGSAAAWCLTYQNSCTNSTPTITDNTLEYTVDMDSDLSANIIIDAGATDAEGDPITLIDLSEIDPAQGTITFDADGNIVFTPADGYTGTITIDFTLTDTAGNEVTGTVTISVEDPACAGLTPISISQLLTVSTTETYTVTATIDGGLPAANSTEAYNVTLTIVRNDTIFGTLSYNYLPDVEQFSSDAIPYLIGDLPFDVIVSVTDNSNCSIANDTLQAIFDPNIGINNVVNGIGFSVMPIPATDWLQLNVSGAAGDVTVRMYDMAGKMAMIQTFKADAANTQTIIPIATLPAGVYVLNVQNAATIWTVKVVKQ